MSEEFPYALFVEGKWDPKTPKLKNKLIIYFQSKKSNGGDCEVHYATSDGQRATVRFKTEQVRNSVLEKQNHELKLGSDLLTLTVYLPPDAKSSKETKPLDDTDKTDESPLKKKKKQCSSTEPESEEEEKHEPASDNKSANQKSVVLENIQDMSKDFLVMLVENVLKEDPESKNFSIEVIPESKCAVITFANTHDAVNFIMCCPNNQIFKRKNLDIRTLEPTKKVQAENLPPNFNSDHVLLYFDKYGETNGQIKMLEEHTAIITFKDVTDVEKVLKQEHLVKNHVIKVFPYYDSLETALYGKARPTLKLPEAFEKTIDQFVWNYLQEQQSELNRIKQAMLEHFSEMDPQNHVVKISPASLILQQGVNTKKLIQTWRENASAAFTTLVSKYKSVSIPIDKDAFDEVKVEVHKDLSSEPVLLHFPEKSVVIAGLAKDVDRVGSAANNIITRITQTIQRVKGSMTDEISMTPSIYKITLLSGLQQEICNLFPELCLNYNDVGHKVTLTGLKHEVLESKNTILQAVISLKRKMVNLHQTILKFISKKEIEEIINLLFLSKNIYASLEIKENHVVIVGKTEKALKESEDQLKNQLCYECFPIEDANVTKQADWHDRINNVNDQFKSSVQKCDINTSDNLVEISGLINSVSTVKKQLFDFVHDNSHAETILRAKKIDVNFIIDNKQEVINNLKSKANINFKDGTISLSGPRKYVNECKPVFEGLLSTVYSCNFKVNMPGANKHFRTKEVMFVAAVKSDTGCIVELTDTPTPSQAGIITGKNTVITPDGLKIIVSKGDMCNYAVDAVVNAANEKLELNGGLSKALGDAAGPQLQEACNKIIKKKTQVNTGDAVLTEPGQLKCKYVIHAVGPRYDQSNSLTQIDLLKKAVKQSMELANEKNCLSIAMPAISSGSLKFPLDLCAGSIVSALKEFCETSTGKPSIKEVHLVDINENTIKAFEAAVQKVYRCSPKKKTLTETLNLLNKPKENLTTSTKQASSSSSITTNEGLKISLLKCNIQDTAADVVVNSIQSDLSLTHGAIPNAIFTAAGPQLQILLNQQATKPVNTGAVFVTGGCNLKNKLVFHAVVTHYKQGQGSEKMLEDIVKKCLEEAENQKQGSIVFPAIGTGQLGFPKQLVASIMLDSVINFSKNRTSSHVKEVIIALYPNDNPTIQAFTDEFNQKLNTQSSSTNISNKGSFSKIISKSGTYETTVGGVVLQAVSGDITKESTDIIVNSSNEAFTLKIGVSKAILDAAGSTVEDECKQLGSQKNEGLIMTQQGNLQCKKIIHVSAKSSTPVIYKRVHQALQMSAKKIFTSIAFPAFGTGQGGVNPIQVADAMLDAVADFVSQTPQSSIKLVRFVIFQAPMLADFHQSMLKREGTPMGLFSKLLKSISKSPVPETRDKIVQQPEDMEFIIGENVEDAVFSICGSSQAAVDKAKQLLEKLIKDELETKSITDPMILMLSDKYKQRIEELQQSNNVSVKIKHTDNVNAETNQKEVTLTVEGLSKDILVVVLEIQSMLKATREEVELKKNMERTSEWVDWQYQLGGKYQSFDQKINFILEEAREQKKTQVDITFQGQVHKVTLPEGPAVPLQGGSQMLIKRVDKIRAENFPEHWDSMAPTDLFKVCPLQSNSTEYQDVLTHFKKTCQLKVLKIERIQNLGQWKNYQTTKQVMEQKNKHQNNEKRLFHGTREDTILHINKDGFNRSYAGLNATAYGKGTYFAVNASYSSSNTYSVPNAQNQKHMYLCRVLTGDYTTGNSSMIAAPPKATNTGDFFDTVVDNANSPTIFVVFRDYQAYPEYLITFN